MPTFDPIFAKDPGNPNNIASNATITIFDPADPNKTPIALTGVEGAALPNPITVDRNGMGPAFQHDTLYRVGWEGGGLSNYFTAYEQMHVEAVAARDAAETSRLLAADAQAAATNAASTAATEAAAAATVETAAALASANAAIDASAQAAQDAAALVDAPAGDVVRSTVLADLDNPASPIGTKVSATIAGEIEPTVAALQAAIARIDALEDAAKYSDLRKAFSDRLALISTEPFNHLAMGDSITEGAGVDGPGKRYPDVLATAVRAEYQPAGVVGGAGYIAAGSIYTNNQYAKWVIAGGATTGNGAGLGGSYLSLFGDGHTATLIFTGTAVRVFYTEYFTNPQITVTIDGVAKPTMPFAASNETATFDYTGLTPGEHTLVITHGAGTASHRIQGALVMNGDETKGWRTFVSARSGSTTPTEPKLANAIAKVDASLATIYYGTNEYRNNVTPATFKTNLSALVDRVRANSDEGVPVLLVKGYQPAHVGTPANPWSAFRNVVAEVSAEKATLIADLEPAFGGPGIPSTTLVPDGVHANNAGQLLIRNEIMKALGLTPPA